MWWTNLLFTQLHFYELIIFFKNNAPTLEWCFITIILPIILLFPINGSFCFKKINKIILFFAALEKAQPLQPEAVWACCSGCRLWAAMPRGDTSGSILWGKLLNSSEQPVPAGMWQLLKRAGRKKCKLLWKSPKPLQLWFLWPQGGDLGLCPAGSVGQGESLFIPGFRGSVSHLSRL